MPVFIFLVFCRLSRRRTARSRAPQMVHTVADSGHNLVATITRCSCQDSVPGWPAIAGRKSDRVGLRSGHPARGFFLQAQRFGQPAARCSAVDRYPHNFFADIIIQRRQIMNHQVKPFIVQALQSFFRKTLNINCQWLTLMSLMSQAANVGIFILISSAI